MKQAIAYVNHARISSWNQPVLSNKGKVSYSRKQRGPSMGLEPTTSTLQVRRVTHCATQPLIDLQIAIPFTKWSNDFPTIILTN